MFCNRGSHAQAASPGPYEWLPFEDAFIVEAFVDLLAGTQIADWTGWTASSWESPNAYNGHQGTDYSLPTGTPVYASAAGTVSEVVSNVPENTGTGHGNYVKIQVSAGVSPRGETVDVITAHLLPNVVVSVGNTVSAGQLIGYSDNTGNSTSEHCHVQCSIRTSGAIACPFYHAHYKYPIMFNPNARVQVGHVVKVKVASTPLRIDRFDTSAVVGTAHQDQLYFASISKRGYYRVFIPNDASNRSAWIRATDVEEVFTGTVIQPLPDAVAYTHGGQLASTYAIRASASDAAAEIGRIRFGGGRFVADQHVSPDWYRIPVPGASDKYGWVRVNSNMVVYPQLYNPAINLASRPDHDLPHNNSFSVGGPVTWGRMKFDRATVQSFSPSSPGGDGLACFMTDFINFGNGNYETITIGRPGDRDYYVECDVYCNYLPTYGTYERVGIFIRDDGFGGFDETFEGRGNCYAMTWDTDDGRLRCCKIIDATEFDFLSPALFVTGDAWRKFRIEAEGTQIRYYLNGALLISVNDTTFPSGPCGIGYTSNIAGNPSQRGGYYDNFNAALLSPPSAVGDWQLYN